MPRASKTSRIADIASSVMAIPVPLQEALRDSITSGTFIDTKFWVFSKRSSKAGRVGEPKALFVNGHVVRRVPRLATLLDKKETKENLRSGFPVDTKPYTGDYDYDDDSDLEEDEDWDSSDIEDSQVIPEKGKTDQPDSATVVNSRDSDTKGNESPDIISVSDVDSLFSDSDDTKTRTEIPTTPTSTHTGTVAVIEDVAFVTFQALLRYLYTNEIEFAPWGSAERRKARAQEETAESYETLKPSPKSIYRLADKYNIPELKELALQQIQRDISQCDIVEEVFSKYTSRYPELRELELEQLARALLSTDSGPALHALGDKIEAYSRGQLPHAKDALPTLYELMESDEAFRGTPTQPPAPSKQDRIGRGRGGLKAALIQSLRSGSFLDSQFFALDSKPQAGTPTIRPIYLSSMVGSTFLSKLVKHSTRIGASTKSLLQCADDYDSDVDNQTSDMGIPVDACPRSACIPERPRPVYELPAPALVLKSGTAKTWSAIFFYAYTSRITFSTIGSPGATTESQGKETPDGSSSVESGPPQEPEVASPPLSGAAATESCSPKSVYALASKVDLKPLRDLAFDNIRSQLNEKNIVHELFSPFTADYKPIIEMQHELFHSDFKPSIERSSLLDIIRDSPLGENPHRAVAMRLVFERSIRDCRERMLAQEKKSLQADPAAKPEGSGKAASTLTAATHPTTTQPPPPATQFKSTTEQPPQPQAMRPQLQAPGNWLLTPETWHRDSKPQLNPLPQPSKPPKAQPPTHKHNPSQSLPQSSTSRMTSIFDDFKPAPPKLPQAPTQHSFNFPKPYGA